MIRLIYIFIYFLSMLCFWSCNKTPNEIKHSDFFLSDNAPYILLKTECEDSIKADVFLDLSINGSFINRDFLIHNSLCFDNQLVSLFWGKSENTETINVYDDFDVKIGSENVHYNKSFIYEPNQYLSYQNIDAVLGIPFSDSSKIWNFNFEYNYIVREESSCFKKLENSMNFPMKLNYINNIINIKVNIPIYLILSNGERIMLHRDFLISNQVVDDIIIFSNTPEFLQFEKNNNDAVWIAVEGYYKKCYNTIGKVGTTTLDSLRVTTVDYKYNSNTEVQYVLGLNFLKRFNIYIDFERRVLSFVPISFKRHIDKKARRFHLRFSELLLKEQRYVIEDIANNNENYFYNKGKGLIIGDEIISANGKLWKDFNITEKEHLYKNDSIVFRIKRNNDYINIIIPVNKNEPVGY